MIFRSSARRDSSQSRTGSLPLVRAKNLTETRCTVEVYQNRYADHPPLPGRGGRDGLASAREVLADLFEGVLVAFADAEAHLDDPGYT